MKTPSYIATSLTSRKPVPMMTGVYFYMNIPNSAGMVEIVSVLDIQNEEEKSELNENVVDGKVENFECDEAVE